MGLLAGEDVLEIWSVHLDAMNAKNPKPERLNSQPGNGPGELSFNDGR